MVSVHLLPAAAKLTGLLAQLSQPGLDTPEEAAMIFSGPQFFVALLSGLVLAFGFQMLLTNLSVATGVSYLTRSSSDGSSSGGMSTGKKITFALGAWTIVTVSLALFVACLLAVKLSLFSSPLLGAITGLVIWGTYFSLLLWLSSTTVGSLIGSVVSSATSSFQTLMGTATAALGAKTVSNQMVATAEATAAAVRRELMGGMDAEDVKENLLDYVSALQSPQLDVSALESEMRRLVSESDLAELGGGQDLETMVDRQAFVEMVASRTDLSKQETRRIGDRLYAAWREGLAAQQQGSAMQELVDYFKSSKPEQLLGQGIGGRLDQLTEELRRNRNQKSNQGSSSSMVEQATQAFTMLSSVVMGRTDLSDFDLQAVLDQLDSARQEAIGQFQTVSEQLPGDLAGDLGLENNPNATRADVESYLLNAYPWQLKHDDLDEQFRNVLFDAEANPNILQENLEAINRNQFRELLTSRGLFTQAELRNICTRLEVIRQQVLKDAITAGKVQAEKSMRRRLEIFLQQSPREELLSNLGEQAFNAIVEDESADAETLRERYSLISAAWIQQFLSARDDFSLEEANELSQRFAQILNRKQADAAGIEQAAQVRLEQQWQAIQNHLRSTNKAELNPDGIKRDLQRLLDEPDQGIRQIRHRLARFDRDSLVALLGERQDISRDEVDSLLDEVESNWTALLNAPQKKTNQIQEQTQAAYYNAKQSIEDYLRGTGKAELNPEGIKRDLQKLMDDPKQGAKAIRDRIARMDRDTLVQLLSQRQDLNELEVESTIATIQDTAQNLVRSPRYLARRAGSQIQSFETALEDYLRNTGKDELRPESIKRDLRIFMNDPRLGSELLGERLARMDRSHIAALLAQRPDMTDEEANAVVNQVFAVRDQALAQVKAVQTRIESTINQILMRIRRYLNGLERPELNYEGIRRDLRQLMDDPQTGFEALRDRLGQFDRDTLVALMSSHDAISANDAERLVMQVEQSRDSVLGKAERLERQLQGRLNDMKLQAQHQFEETQRAAEAAAWWLFGTALVSALSAAFAGGLAAAG